MRTHKEVTMSQTTHKALDKETLEITSVYTTSKSNLLMRKQALLDDKDRIEQEIAKIDNKLDVLTQAKG